MLFQCKNRANIPRTGSLATWDNVTASKTRVLVAGNELSSSQIREIILVQPFQYGGITERRPLSKVLGVLLAAIYVKFIATDYIL